MEKIKKRAILYFEKSLKALKPNCSITEASFAIDFCGGHLGYQGVKVEDVGELFDAHLIGGQVVDRLVAPTAVW